MKKGFIIGAAVLLCSALGASIYLRTAFEPKRGGQSPEARPH